MLVICCEECETFALQFMVMVSFELSMSPRDVAFLHKDEPISPFVDGRTPVNDCLQ